MREHACYSPSEAGSQLCRRLQKKAWPRRRLCPKVIALRECFNKFDKDVYLARFAFSIAETQVHFGQCSLQTRFSQDKSGSVEKRELAKIIAEYFPEACF